MTVRKWRPLHDYQKNRASNEYEMQSKNLWRVLGQYGQLQYKKKRPTDHCLRKVSCY